MSKSFYKYDFPIVGTVAIGENGQAITHIVFGAEALPSGYGEEETPLLQQAAAQLKEYLEGERRDFDLPLEFQGTDFQKRVWNALLAIPYGTTCTYKDIAQRVGSPKGFRAVGLANNRNPISIVAPCHRVIGANGKLVGYGGGLETKAKLLELEEKNARKDG